MNNNNNNKRPNRNRGGNNRSQASSKSRSLVTSTGRNVSRGAALRAQKRTVADANRVAAQYSDAKGNGDKATTEKRRANVLDTGPELRVIGLGGMDGGGSK